MNYDRALFSKFEHLPEVKTLKDWWAEFSETSRYLFGPSCCEQGDCSKCCEVSDKRLELEKAAFQAALKESQKKYHESP